MVDTQFPIRRTLFGKETGIALAVLLLLYGMAYAIPVPPFQLPGYLLMIGFDFIDPFLPPVGAVGYEVLFGVYLYGLAVIIGAISRGVRDRGDSGRAIDDETNGRATNIAYPTAISLILIALLAIGIGILPAIAPPTVETGQCSGSASESGGAGPVECTTETYTAKPSLNMYALTAGVILLLGAGGVVIAGQHISIDVDVGFKP
jgi:hypothetical protein